MLISGLLILILPPSRWGLIWRSILDFPTWVCETYIWRRYGPECTFGKPNVAFEMSISGETRIYKAKVLLSVFLLKKAADYYPVRIVVDKVRTRLYLEQKRGGRKLDPIPLELVPGTSREVLLSTPGENRRELEFSWNFVNNPSVAFIDIQRPPYKCVIKGINLHLSNIKKFRELSQSWKITNAKGKPGTSH
jgi:hypothetical protein